MFLLLVFRVSKNVSSIPRRVWGPVCLLCSLPDAFNQISLDWDFLTWHSIFFQYSEPKHIFITSRLPLYGLHNKNLMQREQTMACGLHNDLTAPCVPKHRKMGKNMLAQLATYFHVQNTLLGPQHVSKSPVRSLFKTTQMFLKDNKIHSSEGCQLWVNGVLAAIKHSIWTSETPHSAHPSQKPEEEEELLTYRSSFGTQRSTRGQWSGILHVCLRETDAGQSTLLQAGGLSAGFTLPSKLRPVFINSIIYVRGMWTCVINGLLFHR